MINAMVYETLLGLHPTTLDYIPALATHWQISPDKMTFRFRIDPNARFSDGTPVTSEDVVATWKLLTDKSLQDPAQTLIYSNFEPPVAESKYIVSVKAKTQNWQNLLYFGNSMLILPAHLLKSVNGAAYIRDYNYKMMPGTGPYIITEQDVNKGNSVRIRKRTDYWAEKDRRNVGLNNFATINQQVVRDENLEFERVKRGDLDLFVLTRAQQWVQELNYPSIKRGLNQKRKIFNNNPNGIQGVAMNTRREPYNDVRVRKALRHLFNRELMIQKLAFNEYFPMDSMYLGSVYENPGNEKIKYDPQKALQLLAEAGWKDRDSAGRLTADGQPLTLEIVYGTPGFERYFTVYQEDLRKLGITLNLRLVTWETLVKLLDDQAFQMALDQLHRRGVSRTRRATCIRRWPTRRTPTTSPASRTSAPTRSWRRTRRSSTSRTASSCCASSTASSPTSIHYIFDVGRSVSAARVLEQVRLSAGDRDAHRRLPRRADRCGGSIRRKPESSKRAMKDPSINLGEGPSDDKLLDRVREDARHNSKRHRGDELFSPAVAADRSDLHRHHASSCS